MYTYSILLLTTLAKGVTCSAEIVAECLVLGLCVAYVLLCMQMNKLEKAEPYQSKLSLAGRVVYPVDAFLSRLAVEYKNSLPVTRKLKEIFIGKHSTVSSREEQEHDPTAWKTFVTEQYGVERTVIEGYEREFADEVLPFIHEQEKKALAVSNQESLYGKMYRLDIWYVLIRVVQPQTIVETGLGQGASAVTSMLALRKNAEENEDSQGKLWTVSYPDTEYQHSDGVLITCDAEYRKLWPEWTLVEGDSLQELPGLLQQLGTIDMFLHDSNHTLPHMIAEFNLAYAVLRKGGVIASDDAQIPIPFTKPFQSFCEVLHIPYRIESNFGFGVIR